MIAGGFKPSLIPQAAGCIRTCGVDNPKPHACHLMMNAVQCAFYLLGEGAGALEL